MDLNQIKIALDEFVSSGGNVNDLGNNDKLYRQIKDSDIFENGVRLSVEEKFRRVGHERAERVDALSRIKNLLDTFIANGGSIDDIKKGTPEYTYIKNTTVYLPNKRRATMQEKFELAGYERKPRRLVPISEITQRLTDYVANGGKIEDLGVNDELYQLVKCIDNRHTLEEKFAMCGQVRHAKKSNDVWDDLKREAHQYVADGNSLHIERKQLPFYEKLHSAKRSYFRKFGKKITSKEALERVGVKGYSDTYYNFLPLFELEKYKDTYGYVDSYRKNDVLDAQIDRFGEYLDMPISLVVSLVANQNLEKSYLQTDTISYISQQLKEFQAEFGSLDNISRLEPQLYNRLCRLKRIIKTDDGKPTSTKELVEMLGAEDTTDAFQDFTEIRDLDFDKDIAPLIEIAKRNNHTISARHIPHSTYRTILDFAARNSTTISDLFAEFNIKYEDSRQNQVFVKLCVDKFPYLHEMRQERDRLAIMLEQEHPEFTKEEFFENYLEICKAVYQQFKPQIDAYGLNEDFDSSSLKSRQTPKSFGE